MLPTIGFEVALNLPLFESPIPAIQLFKPARLFNIHARKYLSPVVRLLPV
jgi:hypothetical protein